MRINFTNKPNNHRLLKVTYLLLILLTLSLAPSANRADLTCQQSKPITPEYKDPAEDGRDRVARYQAMTMRPWTLVQYKLVSPSVPPSNAKKLRDAMVVFYNNVRAGQRWPQT